MRSALLVGIEGHEGATYPVGEAIVGSVIRVPLMQTHAASYVASQGNVGPLSADPIDIRLVYLHHYAINGRIFRILSESGDGLLIRGIDVIRGLLTLPPSRIRDCRVQIDPEQETM